MLDEGLELLVDLWSGDPVLHRGERFVAEGARMRPTAVQEPRVPIWIGARHGNRRPLRRAARYDGLFPVQVDHPDQLTEMLEVVHEHRISTDPYDVMIARPAVEAADAGAGSTPAPPGGPPGSTPSRSTPPPSAARSPTNRPDSSSGAPSSLLGPASQIRLSTVGLLRLADSAASLGAGRASGFAGGGHAPGGGHRGEQGRGLVAALEVLVLGDRCRPRCRRRPAPTPGRRAGTTIVRMAMAVSMLPEKSR